VDGKGLLSGRPQFHLFRDVPKGGGRGTLIQDEERDLMHEITGAYDRVSIEMFERSPLCTETM
jgi:hypothetical protein